MLQPKQAVYPLLLVALAGASAATAEDLMQHNGSQLYQRFCASCHGKSGEGNGPVAPFFKLLPPDLTQLARRSGGTFPAAKLQRIIDGREDLTPHGAREMPVWGLQFEMASGESAQARSNAQASIVRLVDYLRTIQKK
jgi:mono/diheme cytochrome c family protein